MNDKVYDLFMVKIVFFIKKSILIFILLISFTVINFLNSNLLKVKESDNIDFYDNNVVKYINFGFRNLLSDYYWLACVQYMGNHIFDDEYKSLYDYLNLISELDPYFIYPYKTSLIILSEYDMDKSIEIAKKGMYFNPGDWEIPFYLGYIYGIVLDNKSLGAAYFDIAKTKPNVLKSARYLGALLRRSIGQLEKSYLFWRSMLENSNDLDDIKKAKIEIERISNMIYLRDNVKVYVEKYNKNPDVLMNDLVDKGLIKEIPTDPMEFVGYGWDEKNQLVKMISIRQK